MMLGIDIGSYSIKIISVNQGKRQSPKSIQIGYEVLPELLREGRASPAELKELTSNLLKKTNPKLKPRRLVLSLPTASAIIKTIEVENGLPEQILENDVLMAITDFVPFPLEDIYFDFSYLNTEDSSSIQMDKRPVVMVASRRALVEKLANSVHFKTLRKKEVEVQAFALANVLNEALARENNYNVKSFDESHDEINGIIDIGFRSSSVCLFSADHLVFSREQPIGGQQLTEAIADSEHVSMADAEVKKCTQFSTIDKSITDNYFTSFCEQIKLSLDIFYASNADVTIRKIYLTGGGSLLTGLVEALRQRLPQVGFEMLPLPDLAKTLESSGRANNASHRLDSGQQMMATVYGLSLRV